MKTQTAKKRDNALSRLFNHLAAEKKKTVTALCLLGLMGIMWARLLGRKTPQTAGAITTQNQSDVTTTGSHPGMGVSFVDLPKIPGRNDVLSKDMFNAGGWKDFVRDIEGAKLVGVDDPNMGLQDGTEEVIKRVAEKLRLEMIVFRENRQAFVNGKLLSVGDKVAVKSGVETYECEVTEIREKAVFLRCGEAKITLKLAPEAKEAD
jgi:hypothetical protein